MHKRNRPWESFALAIVALAASAACADQPQPPPDAGVGDLEIVAFRSVPNKDETFDIELEFFDNLTKPTTIGIAVQVNHGEAQALTLNCKDVAGQQNTCKGGTGTCSGSCPDRTYDVFPNKVFPGTCKKPKIGPKVCSCTDYKVKSNLGLSLTLAPSDSLTVTLDPRNQYEEASEENNSLTIEGSAEGKGKGQQG